MKDTSWVLPYLEKLFSRTDISEIRASIKNKLPKKLYKYFSFEDEYALSNLEFGIIHFSSPSTFNDPFDCSLGDNYFSEIEIDMRRHNINFPNYIESMNGINKVIHDNYRITCFSERPDNILLWSLYSNKHKGICIEYNLDNINEVYGYYLLPVLYSIDRPDIRKMTHNNNIQAAIFEVMLNKAKYWEYEEEWRIIRYKEYLKDDNLINDMVSAVYLGANIDDNNRIRTIELVDKLNENRSINNEINLYAFSNSISKYELICNNMKA